MVHEELNQVAAKIFVLWRLQTKHSPPLFQLPPASCRSWLTLFPLHTPPCLLWPWFLPFSSNRRISWPFGPTVIHSNLTSSRPFIAYLQSLSMGGDTLTGSGDLGENILGVYDSVSQNIRILLQVFRACEGLMKVLTYQGTNPTDIL